MIDQQLLSDAQAGDAESQFNVGVCFATNNSGDQNNDQAIFWLRKAADNNHAGAQLEFEKILINGSGEKRNINEGLRYITRSAENGNSNAMIYLGVHNKNGDIITKDIEKSLYWFMQALTLHPDDDLLLMEIGQIYVDLLKPEESTEYFDKASDLGNPAGTVVALGVHVALGDSLLASIPEAAYREFKLAEIMSKRLPQNVLDEDEHGAIQQSLTAMNAGLGMVLFFGKAEGNPIPYLRKAAKAGNSFSAMLLAQHLYLNAPPEHRPELIAQSFRATSDAVRDSDTFMPFQKCLALQYLADFYIHGVGGATQDHNKAYNYYNIAASIDCDFAHVAKDKLANFRITAQYGNVSRNNDAEAQYAQRQIDQMIRKDKSSITM